MSDIMYLNLGYNDRRAYLAALAEAYDVPIESVLALAIMLGREEDFDGLPAMLNEDQECGG